MQQEIQSFVELGIMPRERQKAAHRMFPLTWSVTCHTAEPEVLLTCSAPQATPYLSVIEQGLIFTTNGPLSGLKCNLSQHWTSPNLSRDFSGKSQPTVFTRTHCGWPDQFSVYPTHVKPHCPWTWSLLASKLGMYWNSILVFIINYSTSIAIIVMFCNYIITYVSFIIL